MQFKFLLQFLKLFCLFHIFHFYNKGFNNFSLIIVRDSFVKIHRVRSYSKITLLTDTAVLVYYVVPMYLRLVLIYPWDSCFNIAPI